MYSLPAPEDSCAQHRQQQICVLPFRLKLVGIQTVYNEAVPGTTALWRGYRKACSGDPGEGSPRIRATAESVCQDPEGNARQGQDEEEARENRGHQGKCETLKEHDKDLEQREHRKALPPRQA